MVDSLDQVTPWCESTAFRTLTRACNYMVGPVGRQYNNDGHRFTADSIFFGREFEHTRYMYIRYHVFAIDGLMASNHIKYWHGEAGCSWWRSQYPTNTAQIFDSTVLKHTSTGSLSLSDDCITAIKEGKKGKARISALLSFFSLYIAHLDSPVENAFAFGIGTFG